MRDNPYDVSLGHIVRIIALMSRGFYLALSMLFAWDGDVIFQADLICLKNVFTLVFYLFFSNLLINSFRTSSAILTPSEAH